MPDRNSSPSCGPLISCRWSGSDCDLGAMFAPVWTDVGQCYTFNAGNLSLDISQSGATDDTHRWQQPLSVVFSNDGSQTPFQFRQDPT